MTQSSAQPVAVFVSGRQHSGNTLVTLLLGRMDGCFAIEEEGIFFEHRPLLDRQADVVARGRWIAGHLKLADAQLAERGVEHLAAWSAGHRDADGLAQYREVMRFLTERAGKRFWAQKGTSYIFYGGEILRDMGEARLVYLVRNPYDVCASKRRRGKWEERLVGWSVSWNKGLRLALGLSEAHPGRVLLLRYEDLARDPEGAARRLCDFVGVPFRADYLDVPHINPSENKYRVVAGARGINRSRLFYFREHLPPREIAALDMLIDRELLARFYPELPHRPGDAPLTSKLAALGLIAKGPAHYGIDKVRFSLRHGGPLAARTLQRLRVR